MRRTVSSDNGKNGKPVRNHVELTANRAEKGLSNIRQPPEAVRAHRKSKGEYVCWRLVRGFEISRKWIITKRNVPPHSLDKEAYILLVRGLEKRPRRRMMNGVCPRGCCCRRRRKNKRVTYLITIWSFRWIERAELWCTLVWPQIKGRG